MTKAQERKETLETNARRELAQGNEYPYDAPRAWWSSKQPPPPPTDWAHAAARGVVHDLCDRQGIKHSFDAVDEDTRVDLVDALAAIIRVAAEPKEPTAARTALLAEWNALPEVIQQWDALGKLQRTIKEMP